MNGRPGGSSKRSISWRRGSRPPLSVWTGVCRNRLAPLRHARALRRRVPRSLQMQRPPHRRLSESLRLSPRPLSDRPHRRHGELRSHQAALLHHPRRHQPHPHRAHRPGAGPDGSARTRAAGLVGKRLTDNSDLHSTSPCKKASLFSQHAQSPRIVQPAHPLGVRHALDVAD